MLKLLCVGGPLDGSTMTILYGNRFRAPIPGEMLEAEPISERMECAYRQQTFVSSDGDVSIWAPEGQSFCATMKMLVEGYAKSPPSARADVVVEGIMSSLAVCGCGGCKPEYLDGLKRAYQFGVHVRNTDGSLQGFVAPNQLRGTGDDT